MTPDPTARLLFRRMTDDDIESMCQLLGDPDVMRHYPTVASLLLGAIAR